jgi:hypothetical protein
MTGMGYRHCAVAWGHGWLCTLSGWLYLGRTYYIWRGDCALLLVVSARRPLFLVRAGAVARGSDSTIKFGSGAASTAASIVTRPAWGLGEP